MKISVDLPCSNEYLYKRLIDAVMMDIKQNTKARPLKDQLVNFSYQKISSNGQKIEITILEQVKNQKYSFKTTANGQSFTSSYQISALNDQQCHVEFIEAAKANSLLQTINDGFMRILFGHQRKKQFIKMLEQMAADYQLLH